MTETSLDVLMEKLIATVTQQINEDSCTEHLNKEVRGKKPESTTGVEWKTYDVDEEYA